MQLKHLYIERFRGIRELDWIVDSFFVCLVGPGDSTKSTILDAIEFALAPRWSIVFDESDFFDSDPSKGLVIRATIGQVPVELLREGKFGLLARGWSPAGDLNDEPSEDDELVLTIQLEVDDAFEPRWRVINNRNPAGVSISTKDREKFGVGRLGPVADRHLTWSRGSALARLTGPGENLSGVLAAASKAARSALDVKDVPDLVDAAKKAQHLGRTVGVAPRAQYQPQLDSQSVAVGIGALSLHDGDVPLRRFGLGTRRLLGLALQREATRGGGITIVDELEHGLEPHRIRRLVRVLRPMAVAIDGVSTNASQVLLTTHSPIVVHELQAAELRIVGCQGGKTVVRSVPDYLQRVLRKVPEAVLSRRIIVCEGRTELGVGLHLDAFWEHETGGFAYRGVALADGGGDDAPAVAEALAYLGYGVVFLGDSDKAIDEGPMKAAGVRIIRWDGGVALEERIAQDLPWHGIVELVERAMAERGVAPVRDAVASRLKITSLSSHPSDWQAIGEPDVRRGIGEAAKAKGWFKRVDLAEGLGAVVTCHLAAIPTSDLAQKIADLKNWVLADGGA